MTFLPPCSTSGWDSEKSISACPQVLCADSPFSKPSLPHPKPAQFPVPNPSTRGSAQHPRPCISRCRRKFGSWWWPKGAPLVPPNWDVPRCTPAVGGCSQLQGAAQMCSLSAPSAAQQPQLNMAPFSLVEKKPARVSRDFMNILHQIRFVVVVVAIYVWVGLCHQQSFQCIDDEWKKTLNQHKPPSNNQTLHGEINMCISGA